MATIWDLEYRLVGPHTVQKEPIDRLEVVPDAEFGFKDSRLVHGCGTEAKFYIRQKPLWTYPTELPVYYCPNCNVCTYWRGPEDVHALRAHHLESAEFWERMAKRAREQAADLGDETG